MAYQLPVVYADTIASGTSTSSGINLTRSWEKVSVVIPTMSTSAQIVVQVSPNSGTSFFNLFAIVPNTATVQANAISIASGVGANGGVVELLGAGAAAPFLRFVASDTVGGGVGFKIICSGS